MVENILVFNASWCAFYFLCFLLLSFTRSWKQEWLISSFLHQMQLLKWAITGTGMHNHFTVITCILLFFLVNVKREPMIFKYSPLLFIPAD